MPWDSRKYLIAVPLIAITGMEYALQGPGFSGFGNSPTLIVIRATKRDHHAGHKATRSTRVTSPKFLSVEETGCFTQLSNTNTLIRVLESK